MIKLDYTNEDFNYIDKNIKVGDICAFGYNEREYQGVWIGKYCKGEIRKFSSITLENQIFICFVYRDIIYGNYLQPNNTSYRMCDAQTMIRKVNKKELYLYNLVRKLNHNQKGIPFVTDYIRKRFTIQYKNK